MSNFVSMSKFFIAIIVTFLFCELCRCQSIEGMYFSSEGLFVQIESSSKSAYQLTVLKNGVTSNFLLSETQNGEYADKKGVHKLKQINNRYALYFKNSTESIFVKKRENDTPTFYKSLTKKDFARGYADAADALDDDKYFYRAYELSNKGVYLCQLLNSTKDKGTKEKVYDIFNGKKFSLRQKKFFFSTDCYTSDTIVIKQYKKYLLNLINHNPLPSFLDDYVSVFPDDLAIQQKRNDVYWENAKEENTIAGYNNYIENFSGKNIELAKTAIQTIEREEKDRIQSEKKRQVELAKEREEKAKKEAERIAVIKLRGNIIKWRLGDRICTEQPAGNIQAAIEQWNDDKTKVKVKILAGYDGMYEGEDLFKGNLVWISPKQWYKCIGDENLNYDIPAYANGGKVDRTKYKFSVGSKVSCMQWGNGNSGYSGVVLDKKDGKYLIKVTSVTVSGIFSSNLSPDACSGHVRLMESKERLDDEGEGSLIWVGKSCVE